MGELRNRSEGSLRLLGQRPPDPMAGAFEAGRGRDQAPYPEGRLSCRFIQRDCSCNIVNNRLRA